MDSKPKLDRKEKVYFVCNSREIQFIMVGRHGSRSKGAEKEEEVGPGYKSSKPAPSDILPVARLHLLMVPQLPK